MTRDVQARDVSHTLVTLQGETLGMVTEIAVLDRRGVTVGARASTDHYWYLDDARFTDVMQTAGAGYCISDVVFDEDSDLYRVDLSMPMRDPETKDLIGVVAMAITAQAMF